MRSQEKKLVNRQKIHYRVRKTDQGTTDRPRLSVYRSLKHIHAQIIDDSKGATLCAISTATEDFKKNYKSCGNVAAAKEAGKKLAELAIGKGITKVVFDRGYFPYHGRIKALADSARASGLKF